MDESAKVGTRGFVDMLIGAFLLVGALVALCLPVYLGTYDQWGVKLKCGNGYHVELLQATIDDHGRDPQDPQYASAGPSPGARPATGYVDQCKSAIAHRRSWVIPVAGLGALILIPELAVWARGASVSSLAPTNTGSASPTDTTLQMAALLDRRDCSHRTSSSNTTL
ncbi:MAG: hypothetical protein ACRDTO_02700 [Mycobacterium sp.]